ncbi:PmbA protein [Candidatus Kinetoplastibacterium desouzaii TCC079E]|uniref:PmbA protein n=1 Tax=Candidatus Kinetoplastidibacterium desouzai TCC079E TaxID=1208919 RepID=M1L329_9PROT|nr:metalloprotease PmbA [Candidatus Kinetoplastibacterium desouzaii]AGF47158.1 PmbA protein [Candidatus Kinetoplastibacterium desouzaii TCC079E]
MINFSSSLSTEYKQEYFNDLVNKILKSAKTVGASSAFVSISESKGLSVSVRKNDIDTIEHAHNSSLDLVVFDGQKSGSASTSDFSEEALRRTAESAWHIAKHTAVDVASGLPDPHLFPREIIDYGIYHEWDKSTDEIVEIAKIAESAALNVDSRITNTDGSFINCGENYSLIGNTLGFIGDCLYSSYSLSVVPIASESNGIMQRDYWSTHDCNPMKLLDPLLVGRIAAERSVSRLSARRIPTGKYPVLFESPVALGLVGSLAQAINGNNLYRKSSFLVDSLGKNVFPSYIDVIDDPHIYGAIGSSSFDAEGVKTKKREIVSEGVIRGYLLSTYTSRKLGMQTTGNAGGSHNLIMSSKNTHSEDNLDYMLKKMHRGLLVTELIGQGINYVTGDYSRGVFGYWVENGIIQYPVQEITIAGNLFDMFNKIVAIGSDVITRGNKTTGSILIEDMYIAGS